MLKITSFLRYFLCKTQETEKNCKNKKNLYTIHEYGIVGRPTQNWQNVFQNMVVALLL